jgi:hypothetical protein
MSKMKPLHSILVVGTIRNVEKTVEKEIRICLRALKNFKEISFFLVESDSNDNTILILEKLKSKIPNFTYLTLGVLSNKIPDQYNRIRYCRNKYVTYIRSLKINKPKFVLVVDLDGMNSALTAKSINSCFEREDWDAVVANQTFGYYDILALRHSKWQENDWRKDWLFYKANLNRFRRNLNKGVFNKLREYLDLDKVNYLLVYSKMIRIPKSYPWISIDSGFGGAAIYRTQVFQKFNYAKEFKTMETDHVSLNRKLVRSGGKIFINPKFINSHFNSYNINRYFIVRLVRIFIWNNKKIYNSKLYRLLKYINRK